MRFRIFNGLRMQEVSAAEYAKRKAQSAWFGASMVFGVVLGVPALHLWNAVDQSLQAGANVFRGYG